MSRAWRIEYEGALYHLLSRGNERSEIFFDERDRHRFLDTIEELSQRSFYIHHNPLRAEMVRRLADYRWCSYRAYAYNRKAPKWLSTDLILSKFECEPDRHQSYR